MNAANFTADSLNKSSVRNQEIHTLAFDTIRSINMEIIEAKESGALYIDTVISNTFSVSHMRPEDAKREIYYIILSNFIGRRFRVMMKERSADTRMLVAWFGKNDLERIRKQQALINYCKKPFDRRTAAETEVVIESMRSIAPLKVGGQQRKKDTAGNSDEDDDDDGDGEGGGDGDGGSDEDD